MPPHTINELAGTDIGTDHGHALSAADQQQLRSFDAKLRAVRDYTAGVANLILSENLRTKGACGGLSSYVSHDVPPRINTGFFPKWLPNHTACHC